MPPSGGSLTVMFCDLVGSTAPLDAIRPRGIARGDPRLIRNAVFQRRRAPMTALSPNYMGDGVLAYFRLSAGRNEDDARAGGAGRGWK